MFIASRRGVSVPKVMGLAFTLLLLASLGSAPLQGAPSQAPPAGHASYIVTLTQGADPLSVAKEHALLPTHLYISAFLGFATEMPPGRLNALVRDPRVESVEPDIELAIIEPVETSLIQGSGISTTAQTLPNGVMRVGAHLNPIASIDGVDERVPATVVVLDTGVDGVHPDLNVNVAQSVDCSSGTCIQGVAVDGNGHGTHVAGTVGALDDNAGVVGVAPGAEIWSVRVCGDAGTCKLSAILGGHDYVSAHASEVDVVNISLGGIGWSSSWEAAINDNVAKGVVVVVAAGNSKQDVDGGDGTLADGNEFIPAVYAQTATVTALADEDGVSGGSGNDTAYGTDDSFATFSNYSATRPTGAGVTGPGAGIDVAAPGVQIISTYPGERYAIMSGTSMASPHVAGLAALLIAAQGPVTDADGARAIRQALIDGAQPMADWRSDDLDINSDRDQSHEGAAQAPTDVPSDPPPPANDPPTADAGGPYTSIVGEAITFDGAASSDPNGDELTYAWDFGDGSTASTISPSHAYATAGTFEVTLTVSDGTASDSATTTSSVDEPLPPPNNAPTADAGGPYSAEVGATILFDGTGSSDPDGDALTYAWNFGDKGSGSGATPEYTYSSAGTYTVTLTVGDGVDTDVTTTTASISEPPPPPNSEPPANNAPTAVAGGPYTGEAGTPITLDASGSSDPDGDTLTYTWDFGDGAQATVPSPTHTYAAVGEYTVTLTVSDGAASDVATTTASITEPPPPPNTPPVADAGGTYSGEAGSVLFFDGSASSDPDGDALTYTWDFGDGTAGSVAIPGHVYASAGTYTVTLTVSDGVDTDATTTTAVIVEASPQPEIASIVEDWIGLNQSDTFVISGSGFAAGASVTLVNGSGPQPKAKVKSISADQIVVTITTKRGGPGRERVWDVLVVNPDGGDAYLFDGFSVLP